MSIIGIDIGGTKTFLAKMSVKKESDQSYHLEVKATSTIPTTKASGNEFYQNLAQQIKHFAGPEIAVIEQIVISQPGLFQKDQSIAANTAVNLFTPPDCHQDIYPEKLFQRALHENNINIQRSFFCNDAIAGFSFVLHQLPPKLLKGYSNKCIIYLCPGTGLGGGIAFINPDKSFKIVTDGHISQLLIPELPEVLKLKFIIRGKTWTIPFPTDLNYQAESLISGNAILEFTQNIDTYLTEKGQSPIFTPLFTPNTLPTSANIAQLVDKNERAKKVFNQVLDYVGQFEAQLCKTIYEGNIKKSFQHLEWKDEDKQLIKGSTFFIDAGDLKKTSSGRKIIKARNNWLKNNGVDYFTFHQPDSLTAVDAVKGAFFLSKV